jgi:hypothetical protein
VLRRGRKNFWHGLLSKSETPLIIPLKTTPPLVCPQLLDGIFGTMQPSVAKPAAPSKPFAKGYSLQEGNELVSLAGHSGGTHRLTL